MAQVLPVHVRQHGGRKTHCHGEGESTARTNTAGSCVTVCYTVGENNGIKQRGLPAEVDMVVSGVRLYVIRCVALCHHTENCRTEQCQQK